MGDVGGWCIYVCVCGVVVVVLVVVVVGVVVKSPPTT